MKYLHHGRIDIEHYLIDDKSELTYIIASN